MRCVVQKVSETSVTVDNEIVGSIGDGFMVLVGAEEGDTDVDVNYCVEKLAGLRIFEDENDKLNLSVSDVGGSMLLVSQFTLLADARHGRRPSFIRAARPEVTEPLFEKVVRGVADRGIPVQTGRFRTSMRVSLVNEGPCTILLDSRKLF